MATAIPTKDITLDHEAGTDRSVFAVWTWSKESTTDHYEVWWEYSTANKGVWFTGPESSENHKISKYSYPDNATSVRFRVKPVAKNKSNSETPEWTATWSGVVNYQVPKNSAVKALKYPKAVKDLEVILEPGTDATYRARCTWDLANTEFVAARWMYRAGKEWFFGTTEEVTDYYVEQDSKKVNHNKWTSTWTAPANATRVRCQVRPMSTIAYETDEVTTYYWSTPWSEWSANDVSSGGSEPTTDAPSKLKIDVENGTERTLLATWSWNKSKTDHYFVHWQYSAGNVDQQGKIVWEEGSTSNVTVKNSSWSVPEQATKVRFWVKAYAQAGASWSESKTSTVLTYSKLTPSVVGAIESSTIKVTNERRSENSVIASWLWSKHSQTDHYEVEWQWSAGDQNLNKEFVYHTDPSTTTDTSSLYSPRSNATRVQVRVKPIAKSNEFTAPWSKFVGFTFSEASKTVTKSNKNVRDISLTLEAGSDRNLIAQWVWTENNTASYNVSWQYSTRQGIWLYGKRNESVDHLYDTYTAPANATRVRFYVRPIAKTKKVQGIDTPYWTANTSKTTYYSFIDTGEPQKAPTPAVVLDGQKLTAEVSIYDELADAVEFEIVADDSLSKGLYRSKVITNHAAITYNATIGSAYKVRARAINFIKLKTTDNDFDTAFANIKSANVQRGEWSEFTENFSTIPAAPESILWHKAISTTEIQLAWSEVPNVSNYKIEYTTNKDYFDHSDQVQRKDAVGATSWTIDGLEPGNTYFFRVCAVNDVGQSSWTPNYADGKSYSAVLGTRPNAPTTWSDTTSAIIGEDLYLYWTHNSEDESAQSDAEVRLIINNEDPIFVEPTVLTDGSLPSYYVFNTENELGGINRDYGTVTDSESYPILDDSEEEITGASEVTYSGFEGAVIIWQVRTKGILPGNEGWSDWSTARTLIVYAQPTLSLYVGNNPEHIDKMYELNRYPLLIYAEAFPAVQHVIGFNVSIIANESYETRDYRGNRMSIRDQQTVFQQYYPATNGNILDISLTAGDMSLDNEITYTVLVTAAMDSSLTADNNWTFIARWDGDVLVPDAEVTINKDRLSAYIRPFCNDEDGELIDDVYLAVYRIEYDGRLVELASNLPNGEITITDPHPSLNYARYRVTATYEATGIMGFRDIPGVFVGETGIVVQWDEEWNPFFTNDGAYEDELVETTDRGSILKLPYNIEVSDSNDMDVALNEYIGRAHPVSYYGTQLGVKGSWQGTIRRDDVETIYGLRRLAVYRGDVYVREPSGVGYWANVNVSFSKRYNEMVIPVTLNVTRVEGGI